MPAAAAHVSYGDNEALFPQVAKVYGWSGQQLRDVIGTLDPDQAVKIQQAYPLAFFDEHLRRHWGHLLDGPSPSFPAVTFVPRVPGTAAPRSLATRIHRAQSRGSARVTRSQAG
ncbi:hypothetical protein [Streptomyces sp. NPDC051704]|uniref:hypothetical protein n=1 Tax=Streptomyces sp. NPDC051704 TaxID=3365671 RepID=UPI003795DC44